MSFSGNINTSVSRHGRDGWTYPLSPDALEERQARMRADSSPERQFDKQVERETDRLRHQIRHPDRRTTLPHNRNQNIGDVAYNNVRARWVEQGIWAEEWGPEYPYLHNDELDMIWIGSQMRRNKFPFRNQQGLTHDPEWGLDIPGGRWGHEPGARAKLGPREKPLEEPPSPPTPQPALGLFGDMKPEKPRKPATTPPNPYVYVQSREAWVRTNEHEAACNLAQFKPSITVPDREASRPLAQFQHQLIYERRWVEDELALFAPGVRGDYDAAARRSLKKNWIEDGIWDEVWGELPGQIWKHERLEAHEYVCEPDPPPPPAKTERLRGQDYRRAWIDEMFPELGGSCMTWGEKPEEDN